MAYRKRTSPVWEFFEPTVTKVNGKDVKQVQCLLCTQQLADGGGTSNLMSHLHAKHLEEYKNCTNDSSKSCKTQSTLHSFSRVCPPECATAITKHIAEFVARDLHPISVVDGQGFTRLLNYLILENCHSFEYFRNTPMGRFLGWSLLPLWKLGGWSCVYPAVVSLLYI